MNSDRNSNIKVELNKDGIKIYTPLIRRDCFWHIVRYNKAYAPYHYTYEECHLSEDGDCPCTSDCKWYINEDAGLSEAYAKLYNDMLKE